MALVGLEVYIRRVSDGRLATGGTGPPGGMGHALNSSRRMSLPMMATLGASPEIRNWGRGRRLEVGGWRGIENRECDRRARQKPRAGVRPGSRARKRAVAESFIQEC